MKTKTTRSMSPVEKQRAIGRTQPLFAALAVIWMLLLAPPTSRSSDHSDVPTVNTVARQDANLTDLHAFVFGDRLVLAVSGNPAIPRGADGYLFPTDVTFEINIDNSSRVIRDDPMHMGGTILDPDRIHEDIVFRIRFDEDGEPEVKTSVHGGKKSSVPILNFFAGLRDDPFIRGPRQGRNIGSIVLEVPLDAVATRQPTLLIWATTKVTGFEGPFQELAGRSLRSMMPENNAMNSMQPRKQARKMHAPPDVMIYDTSLPASFPNGRALTDDVVDLVGDLRVLANDAPFPSTNDVPFLSEFPYLAPPHAPQ